MIASVPLCSYAPGYSLLYIYISETLFLNCVISGVIVTCIMALTFDRINLSISRFDLDVYTECTGSVY